MRLLRGRILSPIEAPPAEPMPATRNNTDSTPSVDGETHVLSLEAGGDTPSEYVVRFATDGLAAGERVLWIEAGASAGRAWRALEAAGVDVARAIAERRLLLSTVRDHLAPQGSFVPRTALAVIQEESLRAERDGFSSLRLVQELTNGDVSALERGVLQEYESGIGALVERYPLRVLCLYDVRHLAEAETSMPLAEHGQVVDSAERVASTDRVGSSERPSGAEGMGAHVPERARDEPDGAPDDPSSRARAALLRWRMELQGRYRNGWEAERRHADLLRLLAAVDAMAATGRGETRPALETLLEGLCLYAESSAGHALLLDEESGTISMAAAWRRHEPDEPDALYRATEAATFRAAEGPVGQVVASGKAVWVPDLRALRDFSRSDEARASGMGAMAVVPITASGKTLGVLEMFAPGIREQDDDVLAVAEHVGVAVGRALVGVGGSDAPGREGLLQSMVELAPDAVVLADEDGRVLSWNAAATQLFGYSRSEIVGRPFTSLISDEQRGPLQRAVASEGAGFTSRMFDTEGLTQDGRVFPAELALTGWSGGEERYFGGIFRETSARKAIEEELRLIGSAVANVRDAIVVTTAGSGGQAPTILYVNHAFSKMTGFSESEVLGRSFGLLAGAKTDESVIRGTYDKLRRGQAATAEVTAYRKDGSEFLLDWSASPIHEPDGSVQHFVSIQRDITAERVAEQALRRADRDPLTSLPNREVLVKRLERSIERTSDRPGYRYALLFLDLDGFKKVNDDHGHLAGDRLLTSAARRLEHTIRPGDTVARFGGDEFVVLLEYVSGISDVIMVAERIQERLRVPFVVGDQQVTLRASLGIALSESGYKDPEDVLRDADAAMYDAKRKGKGRAEFFDGERYVDIVSVMNLQEDLRRSIERDELRLHYQPLVHLGTGGIIGFEALVRWLHPERGLVQPEHFIPLAERSGLIDSIGAWVLREACLAAAHWRVPTATEDPLLLSVNLSLHELAQPGLVDTVAAVLEESGLEPSRLQIELTESVFAETLEPIRSRLAALRELGVRVCIDDFGTGYSSLAYLHSFPVDKLKIDRLFVKHMGDAPENAEIIRTILMLASTLSLDVVAEGVETSDQLARLRDMACRYGQGFLFSAPVRSEEVDLLLSTHTSTSWH